MAASRLSCPSHWIYTSYICLFLIQGATHGAKIRWKMEDSAWDPKKEGTNMVFSCVAHQLKTVFSAVSVERNLPDGNPELVATNQVVENKFRELRYKGRIRYSSVYDLLQNRTGFIGTLTLTIRAVQSEDAGFYRCKAEGTYTEYKTLAVRVPIEDIYMRMFTPNDTSKPIPDGTIVNMKENQRGGIACSIALRTQFLQPEVMLTADGRDITELFTEAPPIETYGTRRPTYTYQFSYHTAQPNPDLHKKSIVCSAYSIGFEGQRGKALAVLDIEFRPIISCDHYEYYAQRGGSVTMICSIRANPRAQITFKFGYYLSDNVYKLTRTYIKDGQYGFTKTESRDGVTNITFSISPIRNSQFQYSYKLDAYNKLGSSAATLILFEGINGMHVISSSTKMTVWAKELYVFQTLVIILFTLRPGKS